MPVNPFETHKDAKSSVAGIKSALMHLREGKPLGIFPAGEVSTYRDGKLMVDKPWEEGAVRLIKKAKVPVIPIYFHAKTVASYFIFSQRLVERYVLQNYHQKYFSKKQNNKSKNRKTNFCKRPRTI